MVERSIESSNRRRPAHEFGGCYPDHKPQRSSAKAIPIDGTAQDWQRMRRKNESSEELRRNLHLRRAGAAREAELSAAIIHRLNEPLASILANAQAAKRWLAIGPPNLPEAVTVIERIIRDARAAGQSMQRIGALFKREPLCKQESAISEMISEAVQLVLGDPKEHEIRIECYFDDDLPRVRVDPAAIQEVLVNLLSNALDALAKARDRQIEFRVTEVNRNVLLTQINDNGPGLADMESVFESFVTTKENGLGIGLAVSRAIVEAHGGQLWAENNPTGGARFCFTLPVFAP